ncbi:MAG: hypothetical protein HY607_04970 [Planctomycetes bacterium]|uniref:DUF6941 family protein n=1 Tax=Candidatus Wunengus californicus TaxID=3367619 RepID=UPI0040264EFA|nr:hypothetical protein [Planctomycetota bacterium]MBI4222019.1 hypothetical protein [Planctomycetota bacterium]
MNKEVFVLCDAATETVGKLNILGAFDNIYSRFAPATHPQCAIALRVRFNQIEKGEHKIRVNIVDEDGKLIMPSLDAKINVDFPQNMDSSIANLILNIHGLKIEKFGKYSVDLAIDGRQEASLPLSFIQVK